MDRHLGQSKDVYFIGYIIRCDIDQKIPILTSASLRSKLVFSGRYHIISNASLDWSLFRNSLFRTDLKIRLPKFRGNSGCLVTQSVS